MSSGRRALPPLLLCVGAPVAAAAQLQISSGIEYSSGDYGELATTQTLAVPLAARVTLGGWSLRASIPYVRVRGPADVTVVIEDGGGSNSGSGSSGSGRSGSSGGSDDDDERVFAADRDEQGFGDASLGLGYSFSALFASPLYLDLTARVRLPTGREAIGLGNGSTDVAVLTELGWDGAGGGIYLGGGRRMQGSGSSAATSVRVDTWQASAGFWRRLGPLSLVGVQGNWREAATPGAADPKSVEFYLARKLSTGWKLEFSAGAGLGDANADYVAGLNFIWRTAGRDR
jgi:hypothetical protein